LRLHHGLWNELDGHLADAVGLTKGITLPFVRHQNAREIGMALETDAEHVVGLSLRKIRNRPDAGYRWHRRRLTGGRDVDHDASLQFVVEKLRHHLESSAPGKRYGVQPRQVR